MNRALLPLFNSTIGITNFPFRSLLLISNVVFLVIAFWFLAYVVNVKYEVSMNFGICCKCQIPSSNEFKCFKGKKAYYIHSNVQCLMHCFSNPTVSRSEFYLLLEPRGGFFSS